MDRFWKDFGFWIDFHFMRRRQSSPIQIKQMKHKEVSDIENRSYKIQPLEVYEEETEKLLEDFKRSPSLFRNYNGRRRLFYIVGVLFLVVTFVLTGKKERKKERKNEKGGSFFSFVS